MRILVLLVSRVGTAAAAVLALGLVGCGGSTPAPAPSTPAPTGTTAAPVTSSTPPAAATPTATPTDTAGRVQLWFAGVQSLFAAVQSDTEQIAAAAGKAAAGNHDTSAIAPLCRKLRSDAARVVAGPAAPDKRIVAAVAAAMQAYAAGATSCLAGDYSATATSLEKGATDLEQANSIINRLD